MALFSSGTVSSASGSASRTIAVVPGRSLMGKISLRLRVFEDLGNQRKTEDEHI
jgi:hypothetical protein